DIKLRPALWFYRQSGTANPHDRRWASSTALSFRVRSPGRRSLFFQARLPLVQSEPKKLSFPLLKSESPSLPNLKFSSLLLKSRISDLQSFRQPPCAPASPPTLDTLSDTNCAVKENPYR